MSNPKKNPLEVLQVKIQDLSGELEKIKVRIRSKLAAPREAAPASASGGVKTIEIRLTLPDLPRLPSRAELSQKLRGVSKRAWAIMIAVLVVIGISVLSFIASHSSGTPAVAAANQTRRPQLVRGNPPFATVLPAGKSIGDLGGWARVSPPGKAPAYAYIDHVGKIQLNVSEQPLPDSFKSDPGSSVAQLAQSFNAGDKFSAAGTTVYVATSDDGSQSVIISLNKLLILISSSSALTNTQWATYITSLH